jgi:hypothetical protein
MPEPTRLAKRSFAWILCVRVSGWLLPFWDADFRAIFSVAVQCSDFETPVHRVLFGHRADHRRLAG